MKKLTPTIINNAFDDLESRIQGDYLSFDRIIQADITQELFEELSYSTGNWPVNIENFYGVRLSSTDSVIGIDFPRYYFINYRETIGSPAIYYDMLCRTGVKSAFELPTIIAAIKKHGLTDLQRDRLNYHH